MKLKIVFLKAFRNEEGIYGLVTEDDDVLYTHYCTNGGFAYGDLYGDRPERQETLKERFGQVEIVRID